METKTKQVKLEWLRSRMFVGTDHLGHSLAIGYQSEDEPKAQGVNPSDMMLLAAASCSAYEFKDRCYCRAKPGKPFPLCLFAL